MEQATPPSREGTAPGAGGQPAPRALLFLQRAVTALFADPGDYARTLDAVCRLAVPELADWCAVDLVCEDGSLARAAVRHADPARQGLADELRALPPATGPLDPEQVVAAGEPVLAASVEADPDLRAARDGAGQAAGIVRRLGIASFVTVPLAARGRCLGALTLAAGDPGRHLGADDQRLAQELAGHAALALDNARLFRDGEEARRLAEQTAQAQHDAARFGEELLGMVSHDLRSPLAAIAASTHLALKRAGEDEALLRPLRRAASAAERMGRMIEELLDLTRARLGGGIPLRRREADLGKIARYAVEEAQAAFPEHPLVHRLHYQKASYDPDRMAQVVQNLIANAMQHGAPRSPVTVEVRPDGEEMVLEVTNQGPPIPADRLADLFEPFGPDGPGRVRKPGLGLFIVQAIVRAHGGTVNVRSGAEATTFTVRVPLQPARAP